VPERVRDCAHGAVWKCADRRSGLTGEVVVFHSFDELKALGREKVAGKIVLFEVRSIHASARGAFGRCLWGRSHIEVWRQVRRMAGRSLRWYAPQEMARSFAAYGL